MESQRKCRGIKLVTKERRRKYLPSEPNTTNLFTKNLLGIEIKNSDITMNTLVYVGFSVLELSKTVMYDFWYDYIKPKYDEREKLSWTVLMFI